MSGRFIVFEGGEGAGKSTQAQRLGATLRNGGHDVVLTREPGGTPVGTQIRELLLGDGELAAKTEAFLFLADRAAHVEQLVRPALNRGAVVVSDRHADSSCVYQGIGRGLGMAFLNGLSRWAAGGLVPDLVVVLDIDPRVGLVRAGRSGDPDRIERESLEFHDRIRAGFLQRAALDRNHRDVLGEHTRYLVVDATLPEDTIARTVLGAAVSLLGEQPVAECAQPPPANPRRAPEYLVRQLAATYPVARRPWGSPTADQQAHLAQARVWADLIWAQAYAAGTTYGLAIQPPQPVLVVESLSHIEWSTT